MYSDCSRFHPNRFTFGGVRARSKVNAIVGWSLPSSRIINKTESIWQCLQLLARKVITAVKQCRQILAYCSMKNVQSWRQAVGTRAVRADEWRWRQPSISAAQQMFSARYTCTNEIWHGKTAKTLSLMKWGNTGLGQLKYLQVAEADWRAVLRQ